MESARDAEDSTPSPSEQAAEGTITDLLIDDDEDADAGCEEEERLTLPILKKPEKYAMVRVHPTVSASVRVLTIMEDRNEVRYLVSKEVFDKLVSADVGGIVRVTWHLAIEYASKRLFVWESGKANSDNLWLRTRRQAIKRAQTEWIAVTTRDGQDGYFVRPSREKLAEPDWRNAPRDPRELVTLAAGGNVITSLDHPVVRRLLGTGV